MYAECRELFSGIFFCFNYLKYTVLKIVKIEYLKSLFVIFEP